MAAAAAAEKTAKCEPSADIVRDDKAQSGEPAKRGDADAAEY